MRAYKKRPWATMAVNMTPLIDVVFLIIIFFIIMINFSEMHIREISLPKADEALPSQVEKKLKISLVVKSEDVLFINRKEIRLAELPRFLESGSVPPTNLTVDLRADENVAYEVIRHVMQKLSAANISKIEFSTLQDQPEPLQEDVADEN